MNNWKQFEKDCFDYLNSKYGNICNLQAMGKSDSTKADIFIETSKVSFYIEVKESKAQSGQFVLLPDIENQKFIFSPRNKTSTNEFTEIITDYMNNDFACFNSAGTAGKNLNLDESIFSNWIIKYYQSKGVKYLITKDSSYIIFPITKFKEYFKINAKYRIKRSGSSIVPKKYHTDVIEALKEKYEIQNIITDDKKVLVISNNQLNKIRFIVNSYEYYLSAQENNSYEIRRLSNTYNMNVIFSISLKHQQDSLDLLQFENELEYSNDK